MGRDEPFSPLQLLLPRRGQPSRQDEHTASDEDRRHEGTSELSKAVVDCALYVDGKRVPGQVPFDCALEKAREHDDGFVWIGAHDPGPAAIETVARHFKLHPFAVEDAIHAHQRPKSEVHGDTFFFVVKSARYVDSDELVEIGEILLFISERFIVTVRHGEGSPLHEVRKDLEERPKLLRLGPSAVLYAVLDRVVDDYAEVIEGLSLDVDEIEQTVFSDEPGNPAERIYKLKREVLEFKRAAQPLSVPLQGLAEGTVDVVDARTAEFFRDVRDHLERDTERIVNVDELLTSILNANLTQLTMRDNQDMRKISAWAAIGIVPTMIFGLYGMNFEHMPELRWTFGYPLVLVVTLLVCIGLHRNFRRSGWL